MIDFEKAFENEQNITDIIITSKIDGIEYKNELHITLVAREDIILNLDDEKSPSLSMVEAAFKRSFLNLMEVIKRELPKD